VAISSDFVSDKMPRSLALLPEKQSSSHREALEVLITG
jgi:hypothetical protein